MTRDLLGHPRRVLGIVLVVLGLVGSFYITWHHYPARQGA